MPKLSFARRQRSTTSSSSSSTGNSSTGDSNFHSSCSRGGGSLVPRNDDSLTLFNSDVLPAQPHHSTLRKVSDEDIRTTTTSTTTPESFKSSSLRKRSSAFLSLVDLDTSSTEDKLRGRSRSSSSLSKTIQDSLELISVPPSSPWGHFVDSSEERFLITRVPASPPASPSSSFIPTFFEPYPAGNTKRQRRSMPKSSLLSKERTNTNGFVLTLPSQSLLHSTEQALQNLKM